MAAKPALIAAGILSVAALGTGGYFANEWRVCSGLEADYISTIESYAEAIETRALVGSLGVNLEEDPKAQKERSDRSLELQVMMLDHIYERCGYDAGKAASNQARDILQDSMKEVLSNP